VRCASAATRLVVFVPCARTGCLIVYSHVIRRNHRIELVVIVQGRQERGRFQRAVLKARVWSHWWVVEHVLDVIVEEPLIGRTKPLQLADVGPVVVGSVSGGCLLSIGVVPGVGVVVVAKVGR